MLAEYEERTAAVGAVVTDEFGEELPVSIVRFLPGQTRWLDAELLLIVQSAKRTTSPSRPSISDRLS